MNITQAKIKAWVKTGAVALGAMAGLTFLASRIPFFATVKKWVLG
jgi:glutamine amidotransferase-like uncharacterized protein